MKFTKIGIWLSVFALLAISCGEDTTQAKKEYDQLFHQVLEIHDEVMPKMADIPQLTKKLDRIADSTANEQRIKEAKAKLKQADKIMMDWMHSFSDEFVRNKAAVQKMSHQELQARIEALQKELNQVKEMQDKIDSSIENARELIQ